MSEELVKRLRSRREAEMIGGYERVEWEDEDALEAADRIEAQAAEIRRLREVLGRIAEETDHDCETMWVTDIVRAALGEPTGTSLLPRRNFWNRLN